jgi:hypothetical protein
MPNAALDLAIRAQAECYVRRRSTKKKRFSCCVYRDSDFDRSVLVGVHYQHKKIIYEEEKAKNHCCPGHFRSLRGFTIDCSYLPAPLIKLKAINQRRTAGDHCFSLVDTSVLNEKQKNHRRFLDSADLVCSDIPIINCDFKNEIINSLIIELMLTVILYIAGIVAFALFFKFIDWFENI